MENGHQVLTAVPTDHRVIESHDEHRVRGLEVVEVTGIAAANVRGNPIVFATGAARVRATDHATVYALDNATVSSSGNARVFATGYSIVRASGRSVVEARSHATVYARDHATVRAYGTGTVVHVLSSDVKVAGGHQVVPTLTKDPIEWCRQNGVKVVDGIATLYRAVDENWRTPNDGLPESVDYTPGAMPVASDWDPDLDGSLGGGLFFSPAAYPTLSCVPMGSKKLRFVSAGVLVSELVPTTLVAAKAPRVVTPAVAVNLHGERARAV